MTNAALLQRDYYFNSAAHYDAMHVSGDDEHSVALHYVSALVREFGIETMLDVGTGTGRAPAFLGRTHTDISIVGVEPVLALLKRARAKPEMDAALLASGSGYHLPFRDASFDAVCQFGVLHHVKDPNQVVQEMTRVARKAVFISDSNRFGQGSLHSRLLKLWLAKCGLWPLANLLKTNGTGYTISAGDGLSYSYSVFDSMDLVSHWADRLLLLPTSQSEHDGWFSPLLTSSHVLLCAFRDC